MKRIIICCLTLLALAMASVTLAAIPVAPGDYTGSRSTPGSSGVEATNGYLEANGGLEISWEIFFDGTFWNYSYTFANSDGSQPISPDVSHWIIEISPEIPFNQISDYIFEANATVEVPSGGFWPADPNFPNESRGGANGGNPNLGTDLVGVKFDTSSDNVGGTYVFKSVEPPVWGDFYVK